MTPTRGCLFSPQTNTYTHTSIYTHIVLYEYPYIETYIHSTINTENACIYICTSFPLPFVWVDMFVYLSNHEYMYVVVGFVLVSIHTHSYVQENAHRLRIKHLWVGCGPLLSPAFPNKFSHLNTGCELNIQQTDGRII